MEYLKDFLIALIAFVAGFLSDRWLIGKLSQVSPLSKPKPGRENF
jgi:hypothetical protein